MSYTAKIIVTNAGTKDQDAFVLVTNDDPRTDDPDNDDLYDPPIELSIKQAQAVAMLVNDLAVIPAVPIKFKISPPQPGENRRN